MQGVCVGNETGGIGGDGEFGDVVTGNGAEFAHDLTALCDVGRGILDGEYLFVGDLDFAFGPDDGVGLRVVNTVRVEGFTSAEYFEAQAARPLHEAHEQAVLVAVNCSIDASGFVCVVFEDGSDGDVGFFGYHGDVFAVSDGFDAVFCACTRDACGFDDDVEGQVHHLHGVGEDDVFALFYGFGCLSSGVADDGFAGVQAGVMICILSCVRVCVADDGYVELIDDARLCDEGCGIMSSADDANAYGAVNLGEELVVDHGILVIVLR